VDIRYTRSVLSAIAVGVWLVLFGVLNYTVVLTASLGTVAARGVPAVLELVAHGMIAAVAAAGVFALWNGSPAASRLAAIAVVLVAAATIQSQFVSWLPRQTSPGQAVPTAVVHGVVALVLLAWLRRPARSSR
jgi:hypothetical protein